MTSKYDVIIAGAGLAGLSLAYKIKQNQKLSSLSILLIDPEKKVKNDRTWCFWSKEQESFEDIVFKKWSKIKFASDAIDKDFDILPYEYKMIRGIDFYNHVTEFLKSQDGVDFLFSKIENIKEENDTVTVITKDRTIYSDVVFKSYYENIDFSGSHFVWQHFKGWIIDCEKECFDPEKAYFMDFRVDQDGETRFFYVLPFNQNCALVELAIFSKEIPEASFYDDYLKTYINQTLKISDYQIIEEELGAIPMTTFNFNNKQSKKIINIGTNGGSVKPSSGYAFKRIQQETDTIITYMMKKNIQHYLSKNTRYHFYDKILLNAILTSKTEGKIVFEKLFDKLKPQTIFKFLDEKGGFFNDLIIFSAPPTIPFMKAFFEEIQKK